MNNRVIVFSEDVQYTNSGMVFLPMDGCRFGQQFARESSPLWLYHVDADGLIGGVGSVQNILGTADTLYGRLDFSDKEIEEQWKADELFFSLQWRMHKTLQVPAGQMYRGYVGPLIVGEIWEPCSGMLQIRKS